MEIDDECEWRLEWLGIYTQKVFALPFMREDLQKKGSLHYGGRGRGQIPCADGSC